MFTSSETLDRTQSFKKGIDKADARRKRQEVTLNNRRNRRQDNLRKKRQVASTPVDLGGMSNSDLPRIMQAICGSEVSQYTEATRILKKLLSQENDPPIDEICKFPEVLFRLVEFLGDRDTDLVFDACWALTNIASGTSENTLAVVQIGSVPAFCALLKHPREDIREQAIWALGNISGESTECRDLIIENNGMSLIVPNLESSSLLLKRNTMWTISNLLRGKEKPKWKKVDVAVGPVCRVLDNCNDHETLIDCLWAISYLTDGKDSQIQEVLDEIDLNRLFNAIMSNDKNTFKSPGIRIIGNIASGSDNQTIAACEAGALQVIADILGTTDKESITKECIWILSNIAAASPELVQDIIDTGAMNHVHYQLSHGSSNIRREAMYVLANMASTGTIRQINWLVHQGCIKHICNMLNVTDVKLLEVALGTLKEILISGGEYAEIVGQNENPYLAEIERCKGLEAIEECQDHENQSIYEAAVEVLEFFPLEEAEPTTPSNELQWGQGFKVPMVTGTPYQSDANGFNTFKF